MNSETAKTTLTQRKRAAVLAAAREEFLESGFSNTSMDRVAERAQVSKRTVYNHFPSKEALFKAITADSIEAMRQAISVHYDPEQTLKAQLTDIAEREVAQVTRPDYIAIFRVFLAEAGQFKAMFDEILEQSGSGHDPIETWVAAAVADQQLAIDNVAMAAGQFTALIKGALFWPLVAGYGEPLTRTEQQVIIDGAVSMFLSHYAKR